MKRFWMRSLTGQWVALMLMALLISQALFFFIYRAEQARTVQALRRDEFLARAGSVARLVDTVSLDLHAEIVMATNTGSVRFWITNAPPEKPADWQRTASLRLLESPRPPEAADLVIRNAKWENLSDESRFGKTSVRFMELPAWNGFGLAVPVKNGLWLNSVYGKPRMITGPSWIYYLSLGIAALLLSLLTVLSVRRVGRPLKRLTESAEKVGRGEEPAALPEVGADDVRKLSLAFNRMQSRLRLFVEDRTRMIAAISHDLRTPITSMRLRAEFIEDQETRGKFISSLDEMKVMTESTLAFARDESATEETRSIEMDALLGSLCADLSAMGWEVEFSDGKRIPWRCRPDALRRAFRNVIENAVRYGKRARVRLETSKEGLDVIVGDDGPGIPMADRERAFDPFVRLEDSRSRSTGGTGLGLSITRSILRNHGGDVYLLDGVGGFEVKLHLPGNEAASA